MSLHTVAQFSVSLLPKMASLEITDSYPGCAPSPPWLTFDETSRVLYCFDEGLLRNNGSVSSYKVSVSGILTMMERKIVPSGPSGGVIYSFHLLLLMLQD
jgi:hypothetical protein